MSESPSVQFVPFDFSNESAYQCLGQQLDSYDGRLQFLIWVHSPYYPHLLDFLLSLKPSIDVVYLVKGSNSQPLPSGLTEDFPLELIQLGTPPTENRWLTDHEICQKVLGVIEVIWSRIV